MYNTIYKQNNQLYTYKNENKFDQYEGRKMKIKMLRYWQEVKIWQILGI